MVSRSATEADERTALLADDANNQQPARAHDEAPTEEAGTEGASADTQLTRKGIVTFAICTLSYFFVVLSASIMQPATAEVVEEIICRRLYPDVADGRDPRCKDNLVQGELSFIDGWALPLFLLPGVVTAVPFGILADTYGRRLGIGLCMLGLLLQQGAMFIICMFFSRLRCAMQYISFWSVAHNLAARCFPASLSDPHRVVGILIELHRRRSDCSQCAHLCCSQQRRPWC